MRTKKKTAEVGNLPGFRKTTEETIAEEVRETAAEEKPSGRERFQLSFDLNEDGTPDLTSMRGRTKEKVQSFFSDPKMAQAFGARVTEPTQGAMMFPPQAIFAMYGGLGAIEAMVAQNVGKIPRDIADRVFTYSPQEMELLVPPTSRVLQKYVPDWMVKYQDELALAMLLTTITMSKVNACIMLKNAGQANSTEIPKKDELNPEVKPN